MKNGNDHSVFHTRYFSFKRRALSVLCVSALIAGMLPLSFLAKAQGDPPELSNLILDKVYELKAVGDYPQGVEPNDIGFAPQVTEYTATAYLSVDTIQVYPFAQSETATVRVNGTEFAYDVDGEAWYKAGRRAPVNAVTIHRMEDAYDAIRAVRRPRTKPGRPVGKLGGMGR